MGNRRRWINIQMSKAEQSLARVEHQRTSTGNKVIYQN